MISCQILSPARIKLQQTRRTSTLHTTAGYLWGLFSHALHAACTALVTSFATYRTHWSSEQQIVPGNSWATGKRRNMHRFEEYVK